MLEGVFERLLLDRLGEYVVLPKDSIQIGVWSGEVVLDNVSLRPSCLTRLKLPVDVSLGRLRKMHIKVPWSSLGSSPVKITLEGLLILAKPAHGAQFDPEAAVRLMNDRKLQQLRSAEQLRAQRHWEEDNAQEARQQQSFTQSFISKIIANLQVVLRDVHIRYEDDITFPDRCLAAGLLVQEFTALTTNANFEECFISAVDSVVHTFKRLTMRNVALYWDSDAVLLKDHSESAALSAMQESINSLGAIQDEANSFPHIFVLCPVSASMNLTMNSRYFEMNAPHYNFELEISNFRITLHHHQYDDMVRLLDNFSAMQKKSEIEVRFSAIRQHHPSSSPGSSRESVIAWWRYASKCIIHLNSTGKRRWLSPASVSLYCRQRRNYVELYKRKRNVPWYPPLTESELSQLTALECELELEDILFFRTFAETDLAAEARRSKQMLEELRKANQSQRGSDWWSTMFGSGAIIDETVDPNLIRLTDEQRRELYQSIDFKEVTQEFTLRPNHIYSVFSIRVVDASVNLLRQAQYLTTLSFQGDAKIELFQGTRFTLSITSATLQDLYTDGSCFPNIMVFKGEGPFAHFVLETDPVDTDANIILNLSVKPVELVYNQLWVQQIIRFFQPVHELSHLRGAALSWSEQRQSEMIVALTNHRVIDVNFSVQHPILFIPRDICNEQCDLLVADLLSFSLISLRTINSVSDESLYGRPPEPHSAYDAFLLNVHGASVSLYSSSASIEGSPPVRVLQRTNCLFGLYTCIDRTSISLAKIVLNGSIPDLNIRLSHEHAKCIADILNAHGRYPIFDDVVVGTNTSDSVAVVPLDDLTSKQEDHISSVEILNRKWFVCSFAIRKLTVGFSNSDCPIVFIDVCGFVFDFWYSLSQSAVQMRLQDVSVQDSRQKGSFSMLMTSKSVDTNEADHELITVSYTVTSCSSPIYEGVDQLIVIEFNSLLVNWNPETVLALMNIIYGATATPEPASSIISASDSSFHSPITDSKHIVIKAHLKKLVLSLNKEIRERQLAVARVCHLCISSDVKRDQITVSGKLGSFSVTKPCPNPSPDSVFRSLVLSSTGSSDLLEFAFDTSGYVQPLSGQHGPKFSLKLNSIQFVYLHQFTMELADYLFQGVLGSVLAQTVSTASDVLLPDYTETEDSASVSLELLISSPRILLPVHPERNLDFIESDLGTISFVRYPQTAHLWQASVRGEQMKLISHINGTEYDCGRLDLDISISFPYPLQPSSYIDVNIVGTHAKATISHEIFILILEVWYRNLMEPPLLLQNVASEQLAAKSPNLKSQISYGFDDLNQSQPMKVVFKISKLHVQCVGPDTRHRSSAYNGVRLATLILDDFLLHYDLKPDQTYQFDFTIKSLDVFDSRSRASHSAFQKMICTNIGADGSEVGIRFSQDATTTCLTISHPSIFVLPHLIVDLLSLFDTSDLVIPSIVSSTQSDANSANEAPVLSSQLILSVSDSRIIFVENISKKDCRIITTKSSFNFTIDNELPSAKGDSSQSSFRNKKLLLSELECFVSRGLTLFSTADRLPVLVPTSLNFTCNDEFVGGYPKSHEILTQLGPISLVLAYEDYQLITNIYRTITGALSRPSVSGRTSVDSGASGGIGSLPGTDPEPNALTTSPPIRSESSVAYSCTIFFDQVKITGINDCLGRFMPLVLLQTVPFKLLIQGSNLHIKVYASSILNIQTFNPRITAWEPALEPCALEISLEHIYEQGLASGNFRRKSLPQGRPVATTVNIDIAGCPSSTTSDDVQAVNVNISSSFLETIFGTVRFWSQTQELKQTNHISNDSVFSPYHLRNETGDRIVYWLDSDANVRDTVDDGCEIPVKIAPFGLIQASSRNSISFSINLQVHGPWLPISGIKFDKVGAKRFILNPTRSSSNPSNMCLIADCTLLNGIKTLTLKSSMVIANNLNAPIVLFSGDARPPVELTNASSEGFGPIAPGQSLSIPLRLLHIDRFYIRPRCDTVQWSQTPFSITALSQMRASESILLRCSSTDRAVSSDFFSYVSGQFAAKSNPSRGCQITIMNPFAFRNMLAAPVNFTIKYGDGAICANGSLNPGDSYFATEFEEDRRPFLLITVQGFKPLDWIRIYPYLVMTDRPLHLADGADFNDSDYIEDYLLLTDLTQYPMRVKIEALFGHAALNQYPERAKIVYTISAAYFFLDRTGLGLDIGWTSDGQPIYPIPAQTCSSRAAEVRCFSYGSLLGSNPISMFGLMPGRDCSIGLRAKGSSEWSSSFNISSVSKDGVLPFVHRPNPDSHLVYLEVGVQFDMSPGRFIGTKLIQFVPRFILVNNTESDLYFIQPDLPSSILRLQPHTKSPLYFACSNTQRRISVSLDGETWSGSFLVHEISQSCVKIPSHPIRSNATVMDANSIPTPVLLDVHIQSARSAIHSFFSIRMSLDPPYRIQNLSSLPIQFRQKLVSPFVPGPFLSLPAGESAPFCWDCLAASRPLLLDFKTDVWQGPVPLDDLSFDQRVGALNTMLRLRVISRGSTKILLVQTSSHRSSAKSQALDMGQKAIDIELSVSVFRICISFIDDRPCEVMLLTLSGIEFFLSSSSSVCQVALQVVSAQLDNMDWELGRGVLYKYPVVLLQNPQPPAPRRSSQQTASSSSPSPSHILVRACVLLNRPGIVFFKYFGVLIQETIVEVDEAFYSMASRFFSIANDSTCWNLDAIDTLSRTTLQAAGPSNDLAAILQSQNEIDAAIALSDLQQKTGSLMFFETLELAPIHIVFSFAKQPSGIELNAVSRSFSVAFKNVDSAPIKLEGKLVRNVFVTADVLLSHLASHYHASVMSRIYTILGSVAVLGNPLGLLSNLGSGLSDFFNDPVDGLVEGNLQGFGQGLKRGSRSLLNQSIYGFGNSLAGISGNLGSGIAALGTSREYRERRAIARARESPDDVLEGIAYGTKNIAYGFADGISGVVIDPLKGAATQGVSGFFKGVASGAVGLFAKPLTGVLDAVSSVSQGVKNTASIPSRKRSQIRLPRILYGTDRVIREYNSKHAIIQQIVRTIEQGRYANLAYIDHMIIGMLLYVFLNTCILVVKLQGAPCLLEEIPWRHVRVDIDECNVWLKQQARTHSLPNLQDRETALNVFRVITQAQVQSMQDDQ